MNSLVFEHETSLYSVHASIRSVSHDGLRAIRKLRYSKRKRGRASPREERDPKKKRSREERRFRGEGERSSSGLKKASQRHWHLRFGLVLHS